MTSTLIALTFLLGGSAAWAAQQSVADSAAPAPKKETRPNCMQDTGSHIKRKEGECVEAPGRVYSHEDIDRTGEINAADALRKLDPAVR